MKIWVILFTWMMVQCLNGALLEHHELGVNATLTNTVVPSNVNVPVTQIIVPDSIEPIPVDEKEKKKMA